MRITRSLRLFAAVAATALLAPATVSAQHRAGHGGRPGPEPIDYTAVQGLSTPDYPQTTRESFRVPMHDGVELYVEVVRPDPAAYPAHDGRWPVILEASPYHGTLADRDGIRIFPDPRAPNAEDPSDRNGVPIGLTGYFAPRGYAVVMADLRGTGRSSGCLDHLGPDDAKDLKAVVEWAASQPWSNGRVGMTGHSYVGSTPSVAAAQQPKGLVTIVPSAGLASMYDHQFHHGVPWRLQWVGPMAAYPALATERHGPPLPVPGPLGTVGDDFGNHPADAACGWRESALTAGSGQVTGQYQEWHAERDWREQAAAIDIPVFMVHGVRDNAARIPAADWFFADRGAGRKDKVWIGQWDHGSSGGATSCAAADPATGHVNCRFQQWQYALHAWFDKHLQRRDVDTGPPVEAFLNGQRVWTARGWGDAPAQFALYPDADGSLDTAAPAPGQTAFTAWAADAGAVRLNHPGGNVLFRSEPVAQDMVLAGTPELDLHVATTSPQGVTLVATLFREAKDGSRDPITYCAMQPLLREGVDRVTPVRPGERMALDPSCFTTAHTVDAGERLVLMLNTHSPHHVGTFSEDARVTVFTGPEATAMRLPLRPGTTVYADDVPLGAPPR